MYCKTCGNALNDNQVVCLNCGCAVGTGVKYCANCGGELNPEAIACMKCGVAKDFGANQAQAPYGQAPVYGQAPYGQSPAYGQPQGYQAPTYGPDGKINWVPYGKDKTTAILLCFFLGFWGIHNFYLGESKKGIFKIIMSLFGIAGIFALIDFIKMLVGSYTVNPDSVI